MRLIDADALIPDRDYYEGGGYDAVSCEQIDNAPTVDTTCPNCDSGYAQGYSDGYLKGKEERPQGEWLEDSGNIACSHCHTIWLYRRTDYCPHCGADMRGET